MCPPTLPFPPQYSLMSSTCCGKEQWKLRLVPCSVGQDRLRGKELLKHSSGPLFRYSQKQFYQTFKRKIIRIVFLPKERADMTGSITATDKSPKKLDTCKTYIVQINSLLFCQSLLAITEKYYKNALPSLIKSTLCTFYVRDISS